MKTFSDFMLEVNTSMRPDEAIFREFMLDAFKAGMTEAADIAGKDAIIQPSNDAWQLLDRRKEAILYARDNLKEI